MAMDTTQEINDSSIEEALSPAAKKQRVLSKACETCKLKKSRCDSSRPQCDTCRRKGVECIYREKGQPGLRPGYGKAVEHRLALLESNMEKMNQSIQNVLSHIQAQPTTATTTAEAFLPTPDTRSSATGTGGQLWQAPQQQIPPDVSSFTTSSPGIEQLDPTLGLATIDTIDSGLPSQDVLQELVSLFLNMVYPWAPLFCKANFMENAFSPERQILLHGIVVLSFRYWNKPTPSADMREAYTKASRDHILLKTIDTCTLVSTQALCLLAIDTLGQGSGPRAWNIMSMLVTAVRHLGIARIPGTPLTETNTPLVRNEDPNDDSGLSIIEAEEKRRLFWTIYSLDRFSSVSHGQLGGVETKNIKLPYPARDEDWGEVVASEWFDATPSIRPVHSQYPVNLWRYYIDLLALVDRSNQLLVQPVNLFLPACSQEWQSGFRRLDNILSSWFESLPREVREAPSNFDPMWIMVHATFHLINIRMYTVAAFPSTASPYLKPSLSARGRCRQVVRNVASLVSSLRSHEIIQLGPMFAFILWVAARSLIILWTTGYENTYGAMPTDLQTLLGGLRQLMTRWPCAQRYVDIIQLILDTKNNPGGASGIEIFNDTRRTAYGLQNCLGSLAVHRKAQIYSQSFDFLDMPLLDVDEISTARIGTFGGEFDGEWL